MQAVQSDEVGWSMQLGRQCRPESACITAVVQSKQSPDTKPYDGYTSIMQSVIPPAELATALEQVITLLIRVSDDPRMRMSST